MKKAAVALVLALAALGLVACGGGGSTTSETTANEAPSETGGGTAEGKSSGSAGTIDFEADPNGGLEYTTTKATAKAGKVTIDFTNPQPLPHDVAIEDSEGETIAKTNTIAEGSDSTTAELKPGNYTFYCTVPGHREAGMEGTLVVK
ncbi:MAG TPA: plastocyanin/azurin family copper-binding protein [Solirubrobacterales bacterium]|nr:plastocyanin/azurin family copper-binding protein [Solirubrobacterales bacterium]